MTEKKKPQVLPEQIHLHSVKIVKGQLSIDEQNVAEDGDVSFQTDYALEVFTSAESSVVRLLLTIGVRGVYADERSLGAAEYTIEFIYSVDELQEFLTIENETVIIDNHLAVTLIMIAYSTARGIVLMRIQGTILEGFIMPVVNPVTLLRFLAEPTNQKKTAQD